MLYRPRLGESLGDETLRYVSSIPEDKEIIPYDILGSQAHVIMLYECKIISREDASAILGALEGLKGRELGDSDSEDVHEAIEAAVIKEAGDERGGRMHTARSRNDQVSLDMRMKMRDDISILCRRALDAAEALVSLAEKHKRTQVPLYTHLQQAQAGTLSHYFLAHADALMRDMDRLADAYVRINKSPLGAGPAGGVSFKLDRKRTAKLLGFSGLVENSLDATSTRDFAAEYVSAVSIMMANLSRIAEDLIIWSSSEFSFVELADEFASPSSVMPQKKNPDILELTRAKAAQTMGDLAGILSSLKGLATGYGRDLQGIKPPVWRASHTAAGALYMIRSVLLTMSVNEKEMARAAKEGYLTALDVAEDLVRHGVPFRKAHAVTGRLVQEAHNSGVQLAKLDAVQMERCAAGDADADELGMILKSSTIVSSLRARASTGSAGYAEQRRMIKSRTKMIDKYRLEAASREDAVSNALGRLDAAVKSLTS